MALLELAFDYAIKALLARRVKIVNFCFLAVEVFAQELLIHSQSWGVSLRART